MKERSVDQMTGWEQEDRRQAAALPLPWEKLRGKCLLLSGGTGFIGSFLCDVFRERNRRYGDGIRVVSLSRRGGESDDTVTYLACDLNQPLPALPQADYVLHLASNTHPRQYAADPVGTITTNLLGCLHLLEYTASQPGARFLLASSVEVYGQGGPAPMAETDFGYLDCNTFRSGYNEAKRTCEALCQSYRKQYGVDCVAVRLARVFGPDRKDDSKAMSQFLKNAVDGQDIVLKSPGKQRFSYCYVADAATAILKVLLDGESGAVYNVSDPDEGRMLADYAGLLADLAGTALRFELNADAGASPATYALLNTEKLTALGWAPAYTVSGGLERTFRILRARQE